MTAIQTSFLSRYEQRSGARGVLVLTDRYASIRPEIIVDLPILYERHLGSFHTALGIYEKVWIDPVYVIVEHYDIDYSSGLVSCLAQRFDVQQDYLGGGEIWLGSHDTEFAEGKAVCLWQSFEVVQDYLGGSEIWLGSHNADFALGRAVCLWQTFEVVQSYLGGTEAWLGSHQADFALGRAVCLWQVFEVIQSYVGGSEAWTSSHGQDFALGKAVCLYQNYHIDQPYVGGVEEWPFFYESFYSSGSSNVLVQNLDVIQPYMGGQEDWTFRFDCVAPSVTSQMFLVGTENTEIAALGVAVCGGYEIKSQWSAEANFAYDSIKEDRYFAVISAWDSCWLYHYLAAAATSEVQVDVLNGEPRTVDVISTFEVTETYTFELFSLYDFTEAGSAQLLCTYDISIAGRFLLHLQEEAYFVYTACLTNVHTGLATIVTTSNLEESVKSLENQRGEEGEWELEYETVAQFYDPDRAPQSRDIVLWRFIVKDGKHWKQGPVVSDVRAVRLPSFMELHFTADWPYRTFESQINAWQFQPTEDDDWFDLGIWVSDSARIDTGELPLLTIPYTSETTNYDVHVPRRETTRYIGIAPIRRFPYEEVGALAIICVP